MWEEILAEAHAVHRADAERQRRLAKAHWNDAFAMARSPGSDSWTLGRSHRPAPRARPSERPKNGG